MKVWLWWALLVVWLPGCSSAGYTEEGSEPSISSRVSFKARARSGLPEQDVSEPARWASEDAAFVDPSDVEAGPAEADVQAFDYECQPGSTEVCITVCGTPGVRTCHKRWGECAPPPEVCNMLDDDCDAGVDEGVMNACGVCGELLQETCNGIDDDCDGQTDEGLLNDCGACGAPPGELCDGIDDDCDGQIDEGLLNDCGACGALPLEVCDGIDDDCDGAVDEGLLNVCGGCGAPPLEQCNGQDDDCDGQIDEGVLNSCGGCGAPPLEQCNGQDDDCDGQIDEAGNLAVDVNLNGDCVFAYCPPHAPYPAGCNITMHGGDDHGCIASQSNVSEVYFQEGDVCNAGHVTGSLICSCAPSGGLHAGNCAINKPIPHYVSVPWQCPGW